MVIRSRKVDPFTVQAFAQSLEAVCKAIRGTFEVFAEAAIFAADSFRKLAESIDQRAITENWRKIMNEQ